MSMKGTADGKYFFEFCRDQKKKCTKNVVVKYNCIIVLQIYYVKSNQNCFLLFMLYM